MFRMVPLPKLRLDRYWLGMILRTALAALALSVAVPALAAPTVAPLAFTQRTLPNGLRVYSMPDTSSLLRLDYRSIVLPGHRDMSSPMIRRPSRGRCMDRPR